MNPAQPETVITVHQPISEPIHKIVHWDNKINQWRIYCGPVNLNQSEVLLENVTFFVQSDARDSIRASMDPEYTGPVAKFSHAVAIGTLVDHDTQGIPEGLWEPVSYNPHKADGFRCDGDCIWSARYIRCLPDGKALIMR